MSKIFVIAGNHVQAERWIKNSLDKRSASGVTTLSRSEYVYVSDAKVLMGIENPHGVFIGTWKERWDIYDVVERLLNQTRQTNKQLEEIWNDLKHLNLDNSTRNIKPTLIYTKGKSWSTTIIDTNPLPYSGRCVGVMKLPDDFDWSKPSERYNEHK